MRDKEKIKTIIKAAFLILLIVVIPLVIYLTNKEFFTQFKSVADVERYIESYGHLSGLVYIVFQIFQVVISVIPGEIFQVAAGYLFGPLWGIVYAIIGCTLGEMVAFGLARVLGRGFVHLFMSEDQFNKYYERLNSNKAYTLCFILYLIPGIPKDILCYVAGASEMRFMPFLLISMAARLPGLIGSIAMGALVDNGSYHIAAIILGIACIIAVLGIIYRNKLSEFMDRLKGKRKESK